MRLRNFVKVFLTTCSVFFLVQQSWAQEKGKWVNISDSVVAKLAADGKKPGEFGPAAGVAVDRVNGDVYMVISNQGLWNCTDHGATFERVDGGTVSGRAISAGPRSMTSFTQAGCCIQHSSYTGASVLRNWPII